MVLGRGGAGHGFGSVLAKDKHIHISISLSYTLVGTAAIKRNGGGFGLQNCKYVEGCLRRLEVSNVLSPFHHCRSQTDTGPDLGRGGGMPGFRNPPPLSPAPSLPQKYSCGCILCVLPGVFSPPFSCASSLDYNNEQLGQPRWIFKVNYCGE